MNLKGEYMKIIDIYNKIAKGEELPKTIKYNDETYKYYGEQIGYSIEGQTTSSWNNLNTYVTPKTINDEVEIIEETPIISKLYINNELQYDLEEKKMPEKLIPTSLKGIDNLEEKIEIAHIDTISVIETLNQLIDYLKSKGDE